MLKLRWNDLLTIFSQGRHDDDPEAGHRLVLGAMREDRLLSALMVSLADRLDHLCTPAGDLDMTRHVIGQDAEAAQLSAQITYRLNEASKPARLRATAEVGR